MFVLFPFNFDPFSAGCSVTGDECMSDQVEELVTRADLPEDCKLHYLLGEEYFGTLTESMFTVFRCMIGGRRCPQDDII